LRTELVAALSLPDESRGWVARASRRARALVRSFQPDVVVSSGPPHAAHVVARLATMGTGIRWLVDLRDPWLQMVADSHQWDPLQGTVLARIIMPRVERAVMARADGVLANTQLAAEQLASRYSHTPVVWVRNGFDPERVPPEPIEPHEGLLISYLGALYGNRSLDVVLEGLRRYIDRGSLPRGPVLLQVAGAAEEPYRSRFNRAISLLRLEDHVIQLGSLGGGEALQQLRRSNLALVLAQDQGLQVPAKLYECIGVGVPTLALAESGSATAEEASSLGAFVVEPDDAEGIADVFARVHRQPYDVPQASPPEILYPNIVERVSRLLSDPDFFVFQSWSRASSQPLREGELATVPEYVPGLSE